MVDSVWELIEHVFKELSRWSIPVPLEIHPQVRVVIRGFDVRGVPWTDELMEIRLGSQIRVVPLEYIPQGLF